MATKYTTDAFGMLVLVQSTFAERKAARKAAQKSCVLGFEVRHAGERVAVFSSKQEAVSFTKSTSVMTQMFGWQVRPSGAAVKIGCASSEPACEILAIHA